MPFLKASYVEPHPEADLQLRKPGYGCFIKSTYRNGIGQRAIERIFDQMVAEPDQKRDNSEANLPPIIPFLSRFILHDMSTHLFGAEAMNDFNNPKRQSPNLNLNSVYAGADLNLLATRAERVRHASLRDPHDPDKMRLGKLAKPMVAAAPTMADRYCDLPRLSEAEMSVQKAYCEQTGGALAELRHVPLIADLRNADDLVMRQFHISVLRFHNAAIDFLRRNPEHGLIADYATAKRLTIWHFQHLIQTEYLQAICRADIVSAILHDRASAYFRSSQTDAIPGLPIEFACIMHALVHSTQRHVYDYNSLHQHVSFDALRQPTGSKTPTRYTGLAPDWVIDWQRFLQVKSATQQGVADRKAYPINSFMTSPCASIAELPTASGQALHAVLWARKQVLTKPQKHVSNWLAQNTNLRDILLQSATSLDTETPLGLYALAEAENEQGDSLGPVGSWVIATTILGCLLDTPNSALNSQFDPLRSPLRTNADAPIATFSDWIEFAA